MDEWEPASAESYTPEQKCAAFDKLHKKAMDHWDTAVEDGRQDEDDKQYIFEDVMELCLGKDVFIHYNKLVD